MKTTTMFGLLRVLLASAAGAFGLATIIASGGGGGGGGTDENGNPLPQAAATWFKSFGGLNDDIAYSAIATRDGGFAFAGKLNDAGGTGDLWLTKLDALGDVVWQRAYGDRLLLQDDQWSLVSTDIPPAQGPDGSIWFLGSGKLDTDPESHDDLVVAKLGPDGNPAWARSYDSGAHPDYTFHFSDGEGQERPQSVTPTPDGGALVAAWSYVRVSIPSGNGAYLQHLRYLWLLKVSSTGFREWSRSITDDQFLYVRQAPLDGGGQDQVVVRVLDNGGLLINVVTELADTFCPSCELKRFRSTRFLHLRSGGELVLNARVPFERVAMAFDEDHYTNRSLAAAQEVDVDGNGTPEAYLLAGSGTDIATLLIDRATHERAMIAVMEADGFVEREVMYDEFVDGSHLATIDRLCAVGTECGYLVSLSEQTDFCAHREPVVVHLDADLGVERELTLAATNAPSCRDIAPVRLEIVIPSDDPPARDVRVFGQQRLANDDGSRDFAIFTGRLQPADQTAITGTYASARIETGADTFSVTPDDQALGIVTTGQSPTEETLTRTNISGETTLSRALTAPADRSGTSDAGFALAQADDEGFIIVGETNSFDANAGSFSAWAVRTDREGRLVWQRRLPGLMMKRGTIPNVLALSDGFVFGAFMKSDGGAVLAKLDTRGDILWLARLPTGQCYECEVRLAALPNGDLMAAGTTANTLGLNPWLARANALGGVTWTRQYVIDAQFSDIAITPDGNVLVSGRKSGKPATWRFAPDGALLSNRSYEIDSLESGLTATPGAGAPRVRVLPDGGFMMALSVLVPASAEAPREDNVLLLRADSAGVAQWERLIGARFSEIVHDLRVLSDGGVLLAGHSNSLGDNLEAFVARLGADGRVSAGCNAGLDEYSQRLGTSIDIAAQVQRTQDMPIQALPPADMRSQATGGGEFMPTAAEVVVARQCSGSASPENPPPAPARFRLNVTSSSALPGAITSSPAGITCGTMGGACSSLFDAQSVVTLRPDPQVRISHWEGCDSSESGVCIVRMTGDKTVHLVLSADGPKFLTITSITGHGSVSDAAGLNCSSSAGGLTGTCSASYVMGSQVTAIALPGAGQSFQGWGGDCVASAIPTRAILVMDANKTCSAVFTGVPAGSPTLTIVPEALDNGNPVDPATIGRITSNVPGIDCGSDCSERYPQHSNVTVTAEVFPTMSSDWEFERFVCPGPVIPPDQLNGRSASIQLTGDVTCTARFRNTIKRLYVDITNEGGTGRVVSEPTRLDCTADCDRPFETGTMVTLRARPIATGQFRTWMNCDAVVPDPDPGVVPPLPGAPVPPVCMVNMFRTVTVAVFFEPLGPGGDSDRALTVAFSGPPTAEAMVLSIPAGIDCTTAGGTCTNPFLSGTVVQLVAVTQPGTLFERFVGCTRDNPDGNPGTNDCEVNMVDDRFIQVRLLRP